MPYSGLALSSSGASTCGNPFTLVASLRPSLSPRLYGSDASSSGFGVGFAEVPPSMVSKLLLWKDRWRFQFSFDSAGGSRQRALDLEAFVPSDLSEDDCSYIAAPSWSSKLRDSSRRLLPPLWCRISGLRPSLVSGKGVKILRSWRPGLPLRRFATVVDLWRALALPALG